MDIDFKVVGDDKVRELIAIRAKELGETTHQSATALMIQWLKSLRADTMIASKTKGKKINVKNVTRQYRPSFVGKEHRFCFKTGRGKKSVEVKIPAKWSLVFDRESVADKSFYCEDIRGEDKIYRYLVVTSSAQRAREIVTQFHEKRVEKHRGLARTAMGIAMAKVSEKAGGTIENPNVKRSALNNIEVISEDNGYDSGDVHILVKDSLDYALKALRGGPNYVNTAKGLAINRVIGMIEHKLKQAGTLDNSLKAQLDSLKS